MVAKENSYYLPSSGLQIPTLLSLKVLATNRIFTSHKILGALDVRPRSLQLAVFQSADFTLQDTIMM